MHAASGFATIDRAGNTVAAVASVVAIALVLGLVTNPTGRDAWITQGDTAQSNVAGLPTVAEYFVIRTIRVVGCEDT